VPAGKLEAAFLRAKAEAIERELAEQAEGGGK
jgi:hypothetical protein